MTPYQEEFAKRTAANAAEVRKALFSLGDSHLLGLFDGLVKEIDDYRSMYARERESRWKADEKISVVSNFAELLKELMKD